MPLFALVDCNNFYASCEKLFDPTLRHTPVVVLSNNDGCVVARSAEAKALGIPMGVPWFKISAQAKQHGIVAFSSNYALYADMSNRVVDVLSQFTPHLEAYSIDESFLDLSGFAARNQVIYGQEIRQWPAAGFMDTKLRCKNETGGSLCEQDDNSAGSSRLRQ